MISLEILTDLMSFMDSKLSYQIQNPYPWLPTLCACICYHITADLHVFIPFRRRGLLLSKMMLRTHISVQVNNMFCKLLWYIRQFHSSQFLNLSYFTSKDNIMDHLLTGRKMIYDVWCCARMNELMYTWYWTLAHKTK